jgi:hypothetical protein
MDNKRRGLVGRIQRVSCTEALWRGSMMVEGNKCQMTDRDFLPRRDLSVLQLATVLL